MKKIFLLAATLALFAACTADYNEFADSPYNKFEDIAFEEQSGGTTVYEEEHRFTLTIAESEDDIDSISISKLSSSNFSTIYIVKTRIEEFPSDSAGLDSLAEEVTYNKTPVKEGQKIAIPESNLIYLLVIAENGNRSIWQVKINVPAKPKSSSSAPSSSESKGSSSSVAKSSSSSKTPDSKSSSSKKQDDKDENSSSSTAKDNDDPTQEDPEQPGDEPEEPEEELNAPELISLELQNLPVTIDNEKMTATINNLPFNKTPEYSPLSTDLTDLTQVEITSLEVVGESNLKVGDKIDVSFGSELTITSGEKKITYKIKGGYQYPNSDFSNWIKGSDKFMELNGWDNGNNSYAESLAQMATDEGRTVNKMESVKAVIKFASGNTFTADFNPKGVSAISMATYDDGNELIDFGKPFAARPEYIEFDSKYIGKGDSCDMYILLENRSGGPDTKNVNRNGSENKLVASAWYRATALTDEPNRSNPDLVTVTPIEGSEYSTVRLKLNYGEPLDDSPIYASRVLNTVATSLKSSKGIDNRLTPISSEEAGELPVTHIRIVIASSADGNEYRGTVGAVLYVDEIRLLY
ncbi:MAG: PCMD domain-containing protein [Fibrobacter sp.]|nr:PCMD domain-containing protein [Fibrobacter sp.]